MADYYDSLSTDQQAAFRAALYAKISPAMCPTVDVGGINAADTLTDAGTRGAAIDCYQTAHNVGAAAGVLDAQTYAAVMGGMPLWEKALLVAGGIFVAMKLFRRKRRK
jgi:hypothetical protein